MGLRGSETEPDSGGGVTVALMTGSARWRKSEGNECVRVEKPIEGAHLKLMCARTHDY